MIKIKVCTKCNQLKPFSEFHRRATGASSGRCSACKPCTNEASKRYNATHSEQLRDSRAQRAGLQSAYMLKWRYNLTVEQFDAMLADQGGGCALCGTTEPGGKGSWHVDHNRACCNGDFSCGECVRGLLCHNHNVGLGFFSDDSRLLIKAVEYLDARKYKKKAP